MDNIDEILILGSDEIVERQGVYLEYFKKFGKDPETIGMFWNDLETIELNMRNAILNNVEYNEYNLLTDEMKKAFDDGDLLFTGSIYCA